MSVYEYEAESGPAIMPLYATLSPNNCLIQVVSTDGVERTVITVPKSAVQLPSTIFETKGIELKVGLLNQAAPRNGK